MATEFDAADAADQALAAARRKAGAALTCQAGCDDCCRRPFAITLQDAERLRAGLRQQPLAVQAEIAARAAAIWARWRWEFPGSDEGILTENQEWREWFFARGAGTPCPVLEEHTGRCRLYPYRPVACRLYGPLIQIGASRTDPCPKCFPGWEAHQIEGTLVEARFPLAGAAALPGAETVIAAALTAGEMTPERRGPLHRS